MNARILEKLRPLQFSNQIAEADTEGLGNSSQCFDRDLVFSPLDVSDIIPCQIRFFRKFFLTQARLDPFGADGFAENSGYFAALPHDVAAKQKHPPDDYQAYLSFYALFA